jgi:hypothetical protein
MLKRTIKYEDYDGNIREEDFYFNLTRTELLSMEMLTVGGLSKKLEKMVKSQEIAAIAEHFEKLILAAYGEKTPDGKRFMKSPELSQAFKETMAYDELFIELSTNDEAAAKFVDAVVQAAKDKPIPIK